jgi:hypothetical protein
VTVCIRVSACRTGRVDIRPERVYVPGVGLRRRLLESTRAVNAVRELHLGMVVLPAIGPGTAGRLTACEHVNVSWGR